MGSVTKDKKKGLVQKFRKSEKTVKLGGIKRLKLIGWNSAHKAIFWKRGHLEEVAPTLALPERRVDD